MSCWDAPVGRGGVCEAYVVVANVLQTGQYLGKGRDDEIVSAVAKYKEGRRGVQQAARLRSTTDRMRVSRKVVVKRHHIYRRRTSHSLWKNFWKSTSAKRRNQSLNDTGRTLDVVDSFGEQGFRPRHPTATMTHSRRQLPWRRLPLRTCTCDKRTIRESATFISADPAVH